jgi:hypothetical protein
MLPAASVSTGRRFHAVTLANNTNEIGGNRDSHNRTGEAGVVVDGGGAVGSRPATIVASGALLVHV